MSHKAAQCLKEQLLSNEHPTARTQVQESDLAIRSCASGEHIQTLGPAIHACFSSDGRLVLTTSDTGVKIWSCASGHCINTLKHNGVKGTAFFSDDGKVIYIYMCVVIDSIYQSVSFTCLVVYIK